MVEVVLTLGSSDELLGLDASGHAGAGNFGSDLVCAAVSFLLRTVALYLGEACEVRAESRGSFSLVLSLEALKSRQVSIEDLQFLARFVQVGLESLVAENAGNVKLIVRYKD
ncbi:MAG: ribosomal-processing cysteine protease Prp [Treponemataceae bacterium]